MSYDFEHQPPGMSSTAKTIIGCGVAAFLCVALICGGLIFLGFRFVDVAQDAAKQVIAEVGKKVDAFAARFEAQGYQRVTGQVVKITSDVKQPTVYTVQAFELAANSEASLAVMAQAADIRGNIDGDLHFFGQALTIHEGSVITGNVYVEMAQVFENHGTVNGEIVRSEEPIEGEVPGEEGAESPESVVKPSPGDVIEKGGAEGDSSPVDPAPPEDAAAKDAPTTEPAADPAESTTQDSPGDAQRDEPNGQQQ